MKRRLLCSLAVVVFLAAAFASLHASAPSGAIFTTVFDGSEVNFNIYQAKEDVYLDGGPGPGARRMEAVVMASRRRGQRDRRRRLRAGHAPI